MAKKAGAPGCLYWILFSALNGIAACKGGFGGRGQREKFWGRARRKAVPDRVNTLLQRPTPYRASSECTLTCLEQEIIPRKSVLISILQEVL